ncbi:MAG: phasin family protein [bacterium]|nr:phasin family protein [bacterium]
MKKTGTTLLQLGLGALVLTKEKIEKAVEQIMEKGNISKSDARSLVNQLVDKGEKAEKELDRKLEKMLAGLMKKLDIPTQKDVNELRAEIEKLKKK